MYPPPLRSKCVGWGWGWCALLTHLSPCLRAQPPLTPLQGTEAGGHTGDIATMPLIPQCTATVFDVIVDGPFLRFKMVINSKRRALLGARAYKILIAALQSDGMAGSLLQASTSAEATSRP